MFPIRKFTWTCGTGNLLTKKTFLSRQKWIKNSSKYTKLNLQDHSLTFFFFLPVSTKETCLQEDPKKIQGFCIKKLFKKAQKQKKVKNERKNFKKWFYGQKIAK